MIQAPICEMVLQLATDRQVHAFDLGETFRVALGRHASNDIQLRSMRVSNYHAEILNEVDGLHVRDLGSTNGTFVNDEAVRRKRIQAGDRIRIGNFSLTVRLLKRSGESSGPSGEEDFAVGTIGHLVPFQPGVAPVKREPGDTNISLPELLTRLSARNVSVRVNVKGSSDAGRVYLDDGNVVHCECGTIRKEKALFRLLAVRKGSYEIEELPPSSDVPNTIASPTESLVIEGLQQNEALERLMTKLPPLVYELAMNEDCKKPVSLLSSNELEIYQDLIRYLTIMRVLEESPFSDFNVLQLIYGLVSKGFFRVTRTSGALLEETSFSRPQAS